MSRKNFCQCVKNCVIVRHGSELLAKGGFADFLLARNRFRTNYKAAFLWDSSALRHIIQTYIEMENVSC